MGNRTTVLVLAALLLFAASFRAEATAPVAQSSSGDQSPVINAGGNATITYGLDEEKLKAILQEREESLLKKLRAASGDEKESRLLEAAVEDCAGEVS